MGTFDYFLVAGYGWSGSSAVVDLLKEYVNTFEADIEFRLIKDPYGIDNLYNNIFFKGDPLNYDTAIRDFIWYARKLYHTPKKLSFEAGLGYEQFFGKEFILTTDNYINSITDYKYTSTWWMFDFKKTKYEILKRKIKNKILRDKVNNDKMFLITISEEEFIQKTKTYINNLFYSYAEKYNVRHIVLDQAVAIVNCIQEMRYIDECKLIIVDRDPRDIYADLLNGKNLLGYDLSETRDANKYVKWHHAWRRKNSQFINDPRILFLNFEDLVISYKSTVEKIEDFLGLKSEQHVKKKVFFNPDLSKKNIGIWKDILSEAELNILDNELKEYYVQ